jgi:hypothetical protein
MHCSPLPRHRSLRRGFALIGISLVASLIFGCDPLDSVSPLPGIADAGSDSSASTSVVGKPDAMKKLLDDVLQQSCARRLDADEQAAWQILHAALAFKDDLYISRHGKPVHFLTDMYAGGKYKGWLFEPGILLDKETGRRGLRSIRQPGEKIGEGHVDQWLGYLSGCNIPLEQTITIDGTTYTFADYLAEVEYDVARNETGEFTWTLMVMANYRKSDYTWKAADGETWTVDRLIERELEWELPRSSCGGSHRMTALSQILQRRLADGLPLTGVWETLKERIDLCAKFSQEHQNSDGTFSTHYWDTEHLGVSRDLKKRIETSGHTFEFLAVALDDAALKEPWMELAAEACCRDIEAAAHTDIECGALYHAASGLRVYYERRFGPWKARAAKDAAKATESASL